jgi:hypothetical protein
VVHPGVRVWFARLIPLAPLSEFLKVDYDRRSITWKAKINAPVERCTCEFGGDGQDEITWRIWVGAIRDVCDRPGRMITTEILEFIAKPCSPICSEELINPVEC